MKQMRSDYNLATFIIKNRIDPVSLHKIAVKTRGSQVHGQRGNSSQTFMTLCYFIAFPKLGPDKCTNIEFYGTSQRGANFMRTSL